MGLQIPVVKKIESRFFHRKRLLLGDNIVAWMGLTSISVLLLSHIISLILKCKGYLSNNMIQRASKSISFYIVIVIFVNSMI